MNCIKKCLLVLSILFHTATSSIAAPAIPAPVEIIQPDGTRISTRIRGDEFQGWVELHKTGHTIIRNKTTGFWEYAEMQPDGNLGSSGIKAEPKGANAPAGFPRGLKPRRNKDAEQQMNLMLKDMYQERLDRSKMKVLPDLSAAASGDWTPLPVSGSKKMLVVLVGFADRAFATTPASWNGAVFDTAAKSVAKYYNENSFNNLNVSPAANTQSGMPAGIVSVTLATNHPNTGGDYTFDSDQAWGNSALAQAADLVDFKGFDTNGDGILDPSELVIYFIVAGYEASCSNLTPSVWAHAWRTTGIGLTAGGKNVQKWAQSGEYFDVTTRMPMGVIAHELGHQMCGLPDLYDTSNNNEAMGVFSLMASGSWGGDSGETDGTTPTIIDAWSREYLGWTTPVTPTASISVSLPAALNASDAALKLVKPASSTTEYFLLENRQPAGWDLGLKSFLGPSWAGGLLLTHIDITAGTQGSNDINKYSVTSLTPGHQGVVPVQASILSCDMLTVGATCRGEATTLFYQNNNSSWGPSTTPNSSFYNGSATNMALNAISLPQSIMTASLDMNAPVNAVCGASHNQGFNAAPVTGFCAVGTPSAVSGNGPWTWNCIGSNGGANANCTAFSNADLIQLLDQNFDTVYAPQLPGGWQSTAGSGSGGAWSTYSGTHHPSGIAAHSPNNVVHFNSFDVSPGTSAYLTSPAFSLVDKTAGKTGLWVYRDSQYSDSDKVNIYINTAGSLANATLLGGVHRYIGNSPPVSTAGWYLYSYDIPAAYTGATNYLLVNGISAYGNDIHLDDIAVTAFSGVTVNGTCGTVNGTTLLTAPTDNLCSSGTATAVSGSGPWTWTCSGTNGGSSENCLASIQTYNVVFASGGNGTLVGTTDQTVNHGSSTTAVNAVPNADYYLVNWTGTGGFVTTAANPLTVKNVNSSMSIVANFSVDPINGVCGNSNGKAFGSAPASYLCTSGIPSVVGGSDSWSWTCNGQYGGTSANCSAQKVVPVLINSGALYATNATVTLDLGMLSGMNYVSLSNDGIKWGKWVAIAPTLTWKLSSGDGLKTVSARFAASINPVSSETYSATITLDTKAPAGTMKINSGKLYTNSALVSIATAVKAPDTAAGIAAICISEIGRAHV